jgi:tripartite-type tricarboxylate transporter receptor subunit TctC
MDEPAELEREARARPAHSQGPGIRSYATRGEVVVKPRLVAGVLWSAVVFSIPGLAYGQGYPTKNIRVLTAGVGGGADLSARVIAQELSISLGQRLIVENRGGAGFVAAETVAKAPPDGYTLLVYGPPFWIGPLIEKAPYDPLRDFVPITLTISAPNILAVHPSLPVKSVKELIALARRSPGALNYASGQSGSASHLGTELFAAMAGIKLVRVPYKSGTAATMDLVAGNVHLSFSSVVPLGPLMVAGRLRGLAISTAQRSALAPDMPTVAESGLPGYESTAAIGVFAPARTPTTIVSQLNQEITRTFRKPELKEKILNMGSEVVASTPEQSAAEIRSDMARLGKVIRDLGIRAE